MSTSVWNGQHAIVTGAASGIGLALSRALLQQGAVVYMADVDGERLWRAAEKLGNGARSRVVDVRDGAAMRDFIARIVEDAGRIDYLFNNAGIGIAGEAHELTAEHYDRIIDVNIRGATNAVAAVYPIMVRQRSGHIVNMASLAGVVPVPLLTPYAMTKHALVGLTVSLRLEAEHFGVKVSAVCPAAVDTPLLNAAMPADLPAVSWRPDVRQYLEQAAGAACAADRLAQEVLRGVEKNRALIVAPFRARAVAVLYRLLPGLVLRESRRALQAQRTHRTNDGSS